MKWVLILFKIVKLKALKEMEILLKELKQQEALLKQCFAPPVMADSKSASSKIIFADLPPSSCATLLTVSAAPFATAIPALVDPVKDIISMR